MNIIFYTETESGYFRALRKCNEYDAFEPLMIKGKVLERKTITGLSNLLSKHVYGSFGLCKVFNQSFIQK